MLGSLQSTSIQLTLATIVLVATGCGGSGLELPSAGSALLESPDPNKKVTGDAQLTLNQTGTYVVRIRVVGVVPKQDS